MGRGARCRPGLGLGVGRTVDCRRTVIVGAERRTDGGTGGRRVVERKEVPVSWTGRAVVAWTAASDNDDQQLPLQQHLASASASASNERTHDQRQWQQCCVSLAGAAGPGAGARLGGLLHCKHPQVSSLLCVRVSVTQVLFQCPCLSLKS